MRTIAAAPGRRLRLGAAAAIAIALERACYEAASVDAQERELASRRWRTLRAHADRVNRQLRAVCCLTAPNY